MSDLVIGIDPDLVKSGVGIVRNGKLEELHALNIVDLQGLIKEGVGIGAHFVVEDVESMKPTFPRHLKAQGKESRERQMQKISQNVGQVKAVARIVCQCLDALGASYTLVKPLGGTAKAAKRNAELFKKMTGWEGRSNEDTRDAAMLALSVTRRLQRAKA
ncbi:hypothetical protein [Marinobacterium stanieri]|uniref:hypothetical protein n=1 Tax=Marinobacterium stanieri TaxID=49186 RepID=UPI0002557822|nr:hypothetical protein [Marinobacterium stanieri]